MQATQPMAKPKPWPAAMIGMTTGADAPPMNRPALYNAVCAVPRTSVGNSSAISVP